jgi:hypothetical protein
MPPLRGWFEWLFTGFVPPPVCSAGCDTVSLAPEGSRLPNLQKRIPSVAKAGRIAPLAARLKARPFKTKKPLLSRRQKDVNKAI